MLVRLHSQEQGDITIKPGKVKVLAGQDSFYFAIFNNADCSAQPITISIGSENKAIFSSKRAGPVSISRMAGMVLNVGNFADVHSNMLGNCFVDERLISFPLSLIISEINLLPAGRPRILLKLKFILKNINPAK